MIYFRATTDEMAEAVNQAFFRMCRPEMAESTENKCQGIFGVEYLSKEGHWEPFLLVPDALRIPRFSDVTQALAGLNAIDSVLDLAPEDMETITAHITKHERVSPLDLIPATFSENLFTREQLVAEGWRFAESGEPE